MPLRASPRPPLQSHPSLPDEWTPEAAESAARSRDLHLTAAHWQILGYAREEWLSTRHVPDACVLSQQTGVPREEIERLFPGDCCAVIAAIAGLVPADEPRGDT